MARVDAKVLRGLAAYLDQQCVLFAIFPEQLSDFSDSGVSQLAVIENGRPWGIGDWVWFDRHREAIEALRSETSVAAETDDAEQEVEILVSE